MIESDKENYKITVPEDWIKHGEIFTDSDFKSHYVCYECQKRVKDLFAGYIAQDAFSFFKHVEVEHAINKTPSFHRSNFNRDEATCRKVSERNSKSKDNRVETIIVEDDVDDEIDQQMSDMFGPETETQDEPKLESIPQSLITESTTAPPMDDKGLILEQHLETLMKYENGGTPLSNLYICTPDSSPNEKLDFKPSRIDFDQSMTVGESELDTSIIATEERTSLRPKSSDVVEEQTTNTAPSMSMINDDTDSNTCTPTVALQGDLRVSIPLNDETNEAILKQRSAQSPTQISLNPKPNQENVQRQAGNSQLPSPKPINTIISYRAYRAEKTRQKRKPSNPIRNTRSSLERSRYIFSDVPPVAPEPTNLQPYSRNLHTTHNNRNVLVPLLPSTNELRNACDSQRAFSNPAGYGPLMNERQNRNNIPGLLSNLGMIRSSLPFPTPNQEQQQLKLLQELHQQKQQLQQEQQNQQLQHLHFQQLQKQQQHQQQQQQQNSTIPQSCVPDNTLEVQRKPPMRRQSHRIFKCKVCGRTMLTESTLENHMTRYHDPSYTDSSLFDCVICRKRLNKASYSRHMSLHGGNYTQPENSCH